MYWEPGLDSQSCKPGCNEGLNKCDKWYDFRAPAGSKPLQSLEMLVATTGDISSKPAFIYWVTVENAGS